jgi:nickel transport protein
MKPANRLRILAVMLALGLGQTARAHEYWIEKTGNRFVLQQGHKTAAHAGDAKVAFDPAIVVQTACTGRNGGTLPLKARGSPPGVDGDCAQISFHLSSGYWTKTPYDTVNKPRTEVKGALQSWLSQETVTRIDHWPSAMAQPAVTGLFIALAADPAALKPGDKFAVRVLLDGKPVPEVAVAYDGETRGATDAEGRINLRVRHGGLQQISASMETPLNDGKAETLIRGATLNFVLP